MYNHTSLAGLPPVQYQNIPVITTNLLANLYGTTAHSLTKNHRSNADRFVAGKHYFKISGQELISLQVTFRALQISAKTRALILWTERGAARHAKMLETDQAWEVFEKLEDCYFNQRSDEPPAPAMYMPPYDSRILCYLRNGLAVASLPLRPDQVVMTFDAFREQARELGFVVVHRDEIEKIMNHLLAE